MKVILWPSYATESRLIRNILLTTNFDILPRLKTRESHGAAPLDWDIRGCSLPLFLRLESARQVVKVDSGLCQPDPREEFIWYPSVSNSGANRAEPFERVVIS